MALFESYERRIKQINEFLNANGIASIEEAEAITKAAGLDVYEEEAEVFFEDRSGHILEDEKLVRLIAMPNVLVTSHQAFLTNEALDNIAERSHRRLPPPTVNFKGIVGKEPYPVAKKAGEVLRSLVLRGVERMKNLFRGNKSRSEVVATFLAILELCKTNAVSLEDDINGENPNVVLLETDKKEEA